jgi:predicted acyl esterase
VAAGPHALAGRGERTADVMRPGGFDQREAPGFHGCRPPYLPLGSRADVLVFQTESLREPTEVTGPIEVHLWVAASAVDTDFTAKLIDVYPPSAWYPQGYALNLTDSIARLRYRNGRERGELVTAGEPVPGDARALSDEQPVHAGAPDPAGRVELELPAVRRQSQHGGGDRAGAARVVADNTVFHERGRESRMVVPIIGIEPMVG